MDKKSKPIRYTLKGQLGEKGKEGRTLLVEDKFKCQYAMKTFRKNKSSAKILKEVELQRACSNLGISPKIVDFNLEEKYIVMEAMDDHLLDEMKKVGGIVTPGQQRQLIDIFKKLDKAKVFQGDANVLNYMVKNGKIYIIDFGFAQKIDEKVIKKVGTDKPNYELMLLSFILKLQEMNCPATSYSILKEHLSDEKKTAFGIK
jgi:tRNA A-37 threonylcarbamoyl transferase component Bud32